MTITRRRRSRLRALPLGRLITEVGHLADELQERITWMCWPHSGEIDPHLVDDEITPQLIADFHRVLSDLIESAKTLQQAYNDRAHWITLTGEQMVEETYERRLRDVEADQQQRASSRRNVAGRFVGGEPRCVSVTAMDRLDRFGHDGLDRPVAVGPLVTEAANSDGHLLEDRAIWCADGPSLEIDSAAFRRPGAHRHSPWCNVPLKLHTVGSARERYRVWAEGQWEQQHSGPQQQWIDEHGKAHEMPRPSNPYAPEPAR